MIIKKQPIIVAAVRRTAATKHTNSHYFFSQRLLHPFV